MLTNITIKNFAIVETLELEFKQGMTVVSGETGAGKSIMVDALSLCLGARTDSKVVRHGQDKADISVTFDIQSYPDVTSWLTEHDLENDEQCILRRVITKEGKSKAYINGRQSPLSDLKFIGSQLVNIHGQHEHQSLLKKDAQRQQVDEYGKLTRLADTVKAKFYDWRKLKERLANLQNQSNDQEARIQLLSYQMQELDQLALQENEIEQLEKEQAFLANIADAQHQSYQAMQVLTNDESANARNMLHYALQAASKIHPKPESLENAIDLLNESIIQVEEACASLQSYQDSLEQNPERLQEVESRLSLIYETARKHKVLPDQLLMLATNIANELALLTGDTSNLEQLKEQEEEAYQELTSLATTLTEKRIQTKEILAKEVETQIQGLGMPHARFHIDCLPLEQVSANGFEEVEFMIASNPGQPAQPIRKVASGGELSRISLGIQVVTAHTSTIPTLIFDEVDVGISGGIAEVVGRMLRAVGSRGQIFCVTHLAQVAAQGHQHLMVSKQVVDEQTSSQIQALHESERATEIARLLGGIELTEQTMAHAREMLNNVQLQ
ncbi:DNA repair protein RecN [Marinomonas agarivorans]|nr:DNA repair protein RecN [Marinomonas agarivorans]